MGLFSIGVYVNYDCFTGEIKEKKRKEKRRKENVHWTEADTFSAEILSISTLF